MNDYIEREAAILALGDEPVVWDDYDMDGRAQSYAWSSHRRGIERVPAADVAPVRHAAKAESAISKTGLMCTACYSDIDADAVYCKYCGALMDGEKADNA